MIREEGDGEDIHMNAIDNNNNMELPVVAPLSPNMNRQLLMPKDQQQSIFLTDSRIEETKWGGGAAASGGGNLV